MKKFKKGDISLNKDSFSHGQIMSKLWMCDELEKYYTLKGHKPKLVFVYGGWYGILPFMMKIKNIFRETKFISFDLEEVSNALALKVNNAFVYEDTSFDVQKRNVNELKPRKSEVDLVINTSCEHIIEDNWFKNLDDGQLVAFQSNNMKHVEHINNVKSLEEMKKKYRLSNIFYAGEKSFDYGVLKFDRFMLIGTK